tara:strand:- start:8694 stop:9587 length:894 start_codon:yes stop_codon:yes gene_type:complete
MTQNVRVTRGSVAKSASAARGSASAARGSAAKSASAARGSAAKSASAARGSAAPRVVNRETMGNNITLSTWNETPISLPPLPPRAFVFKDHKKDKTWKFTGKKKGKNVEYVSDDGADVKFEIEYNANGPVEIYLAQLYLSKNKPNEGIPAAAVISALKRMVPETKLKLLWVANYSKVPIPSELVHVPRELLPPNKYDIYNGFTPTKGNTWPYLKDLQQITAAILSNTHKLKESEVRQLLNPLLKDRLDDEQFAAKLQRLVTAASMGKGYNMSALSKLLSDTNLLHSRPLQRYYPRKP